MVVSLYVQSSMDNFLLNLVFLILFLHCNVCNTMLQIKNVLQLTNEFLIYALISQHCDSLGCYPPLIAHFHQKNLLKIFIETHKKCVAVKIVKL
jgi:hypothetical protein